MRRYRMGIAAAAAVTFSAAAGVGSARPEAPMRIMAHRGVHQTYPAEGLERDTCTATRIYPPTHAFLENTLASTAEAIRLGADTVEIDVHPTTDGEFAVFHDWTLECRTEATGTVRSHTMPYLRTLDLGYGYTADGGGTFPLRGRGVGLMPTLNEMLDAFPQARFQINIKSNDPQEADLLHAYLAGRPNIDARLAYFAGDRPAARLRVLRPEARIATKAGLKACLKSWLLTGWTGRTPGSCRNTVLTVPANLGWMLWGWPNGFVDRMGRANTEVWLAGRADLKAGRIERLDTVEALGVIPEGWRGGVDTDRIDVVGPALRER